MSMNSGKQDFRKAVNKALGQREREEAITELVDANECEKLAILVQLSGLDAPFRRQALNGMDQIGCDDYLRTLAESGGLEDSLRTDIENSLDP